CPCDTYQMPVSDRAHLDDFSLDEFHSIVLSKDSGLCHSVILVHSKKFFADFAHRVPSRQSIPKGLGKCHTYRMFKKMHGQEPKVAKKSSSLSRQERESALRTVDFVLARSTYVWRTNKNDDIQQAIIGVCSFLRAVSRSHCRNGRDPA